VPELREALGWRATLSQVALMLLGIALLALAAVLE
jgi:hypothetical protein